MNGIDWMYGEWWNEKCRQFKLCTMTSANWTVNIVKRISQNSNANRKFSNNYNDITEK